MKNILLRFLLLFIFLPFSAFASLSIDEDISFRGGGTNDSRGFDWLLQELTIRVMADGSINGSIDISGVPGGTRACGLGQVNGFVSNNIIEFSYVMAETEFGCLSLNGSVVSFSGTFSDDFTEVQGTWISSVGQQGTFSFTTNPGNYTIGFFNGVGNTREDADFATSFFEVVVIGDEFNQRSIEYETFYNHTGSEVDSFVGQDVIEVFIQRAEELDFDFSNNMWLLWLAIANDSGSILDNLGSISSQLLVFLDDLRANIVTELVAIIGNILSDPPTRDDYIEHELQFKDIALKGNRFLMIAHSQGNLFMNNAYTLALGTEGYGADNISAIHIAPASIDINGPYVLANIDIVINALRLFGVNAVPDVNFDMPLDHLEEVDLSGHELLKTYMFPGIPDGSYPAQTIIGNILSELERLEIPINVTF